VNFTTSDNLQSHQPQNLRDTDGDVRANTERYYTSYTMTPLQRYWPTIPKVKVRDMVRAIGLRFS